jgi:hypothetical protein
MTIPVFAVISYAVMPATVSSRPGTPLTSRWAALVPTVAA